MTIIRKNEKYGIYIKAGGYILTPLKKNDNMVVFGLGTEFKVGDKVRAGEADGKLITVREGLKKFEGNREETWIKRKMYL